MPYANIPFIFGSGLNTKYHPQQLPLGTLSILENGIFTHTGAIDKRNGYSKLSNLIVGETSHISQAKSTAVYNLQDLLTFDGNYVYSYVPSLSRWANRGSCTAVAVDATVVLANASQQSNPSCIVGKGVELYAWEDSRGGIRYTIQDAQTKTKLISDHLLSGAGFNPQCLQFGDYLMVIYQTTTSQIIGALISPGNPAHPNNYYLFSNANVINPTYTTAQSDGYLYLIASNIGGAHNIRQFDSVLGLHQEITASTFGTSTAISAFIDNNNLVVGFGTDTGDVKMYAYSTDLSTNSISLTTIDNATISHITSIAFNDYYFVYDDITGARPIIRAAITDNAGVVLSASLFKNSVSLVSQVFEYNNNLYVLSVYESDLQPTYFLLNSNGEVVAKAETDEAGGFRNSSNLSPVNMIDDNSFLIATQHRGIIETQNVQEYQLKNVSSTLLQFNNSYKSAMLGNILHLTGGILQQYDGNQVVEHGFHLFPEGIVSATGSSGFIDDGTYTWQFTYEWTNNLGETERSAPSDPVVLTLSGGSNSVIFSIPTLALTKKDNVILTVYRTQQATSGDPLLYRISSITSPLLNSPTDNFLLYTDTTNDTAIIGNNVLYSSPDINGQLIELENIAAPNCTIITTYKNRIFLAGLDHPNQIWFSKTVVPGEPAAFNDVLSLDIDPRGGEITGLAIMDNNLIIFKQESTYLLSGVGPNNSGAQNDFTDPQQIASDVGCINQNSIVLVSSLGLFFQSSKGIYLLDRTLQSSYIGAPVQDFNNQTIVSATQIPGTTQVRFLSSDGKALVYDYYVQQWSTFTNMKAIDAGIWNNIFYYATSAGIVYQEVAGQYTDQTTPINLKIATGWINLGNLLNYQLVNSFLLLGQFYGKHQLLVEIGYDGNENLIYSGLLDTTDIITQAIWGEQNTYGQNGIYGGSYAQEIFRVFLTNPRCRSCKIRITEQNTEGNQGLTFLALNLRIMQKVGMDKVAPQNQSGVS